MIHYEPQVREYLRIAVPLADSMEQVSAHFCEAPYFAVVLLRLADGNIKRMEVVRLLKNTQFRSSSRKAKI